MKCFLASIVLLLSFVSFAFAQSGEINIIPKPNSINGKNGHFTIDRKTTLVATNDTERRLAEHLNTILAKDLGFTVRIDKNTRGSNEVIFYETTFGERLRPNKYLLIVQPKGISLSGSEEGLFYAIQSLRQMLPVAKGNKFRLPAVEIEDGPRFQYRGMHLDIARHFQPVEFVKRYIDLMSQYKFNTFHWHLTDDQGWRIEIKRYPKLTEIGSTRPETVKERNLSPYIGDGIPHGGFYTQEQIKDVVKYAKERYITVIPEIELPGHASAALAAYPELGCKADYKYKVQTTWGIFKETFCPTETTFKFLEDVLDETIKLFPDSPYIHIGGDEVLKDHWKESAFVQELKQKENLKDEHEVQSYFVRRIEKFVNSKGKKIIGWDEILEGGVAPNATIMSWRGMKGGIEAAKAKHDVIMTPTDFVYFDYGQGDPAYEPLNIGSYVPLEKVYSFEPVPSELTAEEAKYIIGGQANIWTEYIKTPSHVEYMAFPRMLALSEVLWSQKEHRNYADFLRRLNAQLPSLDRQGVNYRIPEPIGLSNVVTQGDRVSIELQPAPGTRILYSTDGSTPDDQSAIYEKPIELALADGEVKTLKTVVVNGVGRKSVVYAATIVRGEYREPMTPGETKPGVNYELVVPSDEGDPKITKGESRSIMLNQFEKVTDLKKPFSAQFDGYLRIPADGVYELQIDSTWDATLLLGDQKLIDDAGTKDRKIRSAIAVITFQTNAA